MVEVQLEPKTIREMIVIAKSLIKEIGQARDTFFSLSLDKERSDVERLQSRRDYLDASTLAFKMNETLKAFVSALPKEFHNETN